MIRNPQQTVLIIQAVAAMGLMVVAVWIFVRLRSRGRTFTCPSCKKEVDREAIRQDGILCSFCGWSAIPRAQSEPDSTLSPSRAGQAERSCRRCGNELADSEPGVRLWDDHVYYRVCVEAGCPQLIEYAAQHDCLEEAIPYSAWRIGLRTFVLCEGSLTALFGTVGFLAGMDKGGIVGGIVGLLGSQILILPVALLYSVVPGRMFALLRPTVSVRAGQLTFRKGNAWSTTHSLDDCQWFEGKASRSFVMGMVVLPGDPAILIALPHGPNEYETLVPVGFNDESRKRWRAFLTLAGITRRTAWEKKAGLARKILSPVAVLLALAGSLAGCVQLHLLVTRSLKALGAAADVSEMLGLLVLLPGWITVVMYGYLLWPWRLVPRVATTRTPDEQAARRRDILWRIGILCACIASVPLVAPNLDVTTRVIGIAIAALWIWIVATDFSRRLAATEWATTLPDPVGSRPRPND